MGLGFGCFVGLEFELGLEVVGSSARGWSWDGPKADVLGSGRLGAISMSVRYSFKPMLAVLAFFLSRSATSVLRHKPVIPGLGILSPPFLSLAFSVVCDFLCCFS